MVGPPLWIDANTALGLAAASATSTDSTSVQVVTKSPTAVQAATRTLISVAPGSVGVASSNGFGYVLAQDDAKNQSCSVYIFAPRCGGGSERAEQRNRKVRRSEVGGEWRRATVGFWGHRRLSKGGESPLQAFQDAGKRGVYLPPYPPSF